MCWKRIYRAQTVLRYRKAQVEVIDSAHAATIEYVVLSTFGIFFFYDFCDRPWCTGQMTETPENSSQPPSQPLASPIPRSSRWKRPTLAVLLSLVFPGMGQLYNRQPRKAFSLALITYILDFLMVKTRLLFAFSTMVVTILALGLWKLFVAAEAGYAAAAATYRRILERDPTHRVALVAVFHLGQTLLHLGRREEGARVLVVHEKMSRLVTKARQHTPPSKSRRDRVPELALPLAQLFSENGFPDLASAARARAANQMAPGSASTSSEPLKSLPESR